MARRVEILTAALLDIFGRITVETDNGVHKATVVAKNDKKNTISVVYDTDPKAKPQTLDMNAFGQFVRKARGRRPGSGTDTTAVPAAPVAAETKPARQPRAVAAPVEQAPAAQPTRRTRATTAAPVTTETAPARQGPPRGTSLLMSFGGKLATVLGKEPSIANLDALLTAVDEGFRKEFKLRRRAPRTEAQAPAPVAAETKPARQPRAVAAPAAPAPAPAAPVAAPRQPRRPTPVAAPVPAPAAPRPARRPVGAPMA